MRSLRGLWPYVGHYKWRIIGGFIALIVTNVLQVHVARVIGQASDAIEAAKGTSDTFVHFALLIVGFTVCLGFFRYLMRLWIIGASRDIEFDFRNDIFAKLLSLTPSFYDRQRTGDLMSKATNDVDAVRSFLGPGILQFFNSVILFPITMVRMISIDPMVTAVTMLPLLVLPIVMNYFGNHVHKRFRTVQDQYSVISAMVQENLAGMRVVKAFTQEHAQKKKFAVLNEQFIDLNLRLARVQAGFYPSLRVLAGLSVVLLMWVGGSRVIEGQTSGDPNAMTVGELVEFSLLQVMLFWPMIAMGWTVSLMQRGAASMERINEILTLQPQILSQPENGVGEVTDGEIEFRNLTFRYQPDLPPALKEISLTVPAGSRLGIVGPTGAGKSTIAHLLAHLYKIDRGQLFIDGHDVNDIPLEQLRAKTAVVFQETFLFSDTIAHNIAFGATESDPDEIEEVAEKAHIAPEIRDFPEQYETMLGERGINLSGGQKQRTAIARAILRDPRILVLDDALSAVDTETEARIIESLHEVLEGRTSVIIAHRISAVMDCDQIIVIDEGQIIEHGTHAELLAGGGLYSNLFENQLLAEAVDKD